MGKKSKAKKSASPGGEANGKLESFALNAYTGAAAVIAGVLARKAVEKVWGKALGRTPPNEPESLDVHWAEAIGWSALSGTTVAIARLMATRKATDVWARAKREQ